MPFIRRNRSRFVDLTSNFPLYVNGWNSYWMLSSDSPESVKEMVIRGRRMGMNVCRTWMLNDGGPNTLQISAGIFDEKIFSLKVNPPEASNPNPKQGHEPTKKRNGAQPQDNWHHARKKRRFNGSCFICGNVGHFARDCSEQKIAEGSTKEWEFKDISKGSVELRVETENTHEEPSAESGLGSSQPGSLQLTSEETKQPDEARDSPRPVHYQLTSEEKVEDHSSSQSIAHRPSLEQKMKLNNSQCDDNQYTSEHTKHREEVRDSFDPVAQDHISSQSVATNQPSSEQGVKFNNLQCGDKQHMSEQSTPDDVSSQPVAYPPPSSEQRMEFNNSQRGDNQYTSEQIKQRIEIRSGSQPVALDEVCSQSIAHQPCSEQTVKFDHSQCGDNPQTSEQIEEVRDSSNPVAPDCISSQSVTNQPSSEQTKQRVEIRGGSQPVAPDGGSSRSIDHQPSSEHKRMKVSQRGDNQRATEQRIIAPSSFRLGSYQPTLNQKKPLYRFWYGSFQHSSHQWNREILIPVTLPRSSRWGPYIPIATPPSFPLYRVPYQYPAPPPPYLRSPPPRLMNFPYYPGYPRF